MRKICGSIIPVMLFIMFCATAAFSAEIDTAKFKLAEKMYQGKNYRGALKELGDLIQNYPYSAQYQKALYYTAKSYFALKDYEQSARFFGVLEKKSSKDTDKRLALFGLGESLYKLKRWKEAAVAFMNFGIRYKNSPAAPAAYYYAALSLEAMNLQADAVSVYRSILSEFPSSAYYAEAAKKIDGIEKSSMRTNAIDISDNALNVIDLSVSAPSITNIVILTNSYFISNSQTVQPVPQNMVITDMTEGPETRGPTVITQQILVIDTNELNLQKEYEANKKKEEEIERFRSLIELKAKLLEIKEKALREKKDAIIENSEDEGSDNE